MENVLERRGDKYLVSYDMGKTALMTAEDIMRDRDNARQLEKLEGKDFIRQLMGKKSNGRRRIESSEEDEVEVSDDEEEDEDDNPDNFGEME